MNIVLIDDHTLFRTGIATMLQNLEPNTNTEGHPTPAQAVESVEHPENIDLVLLDYHIPTTTTKNNIESVRDHFLNAKLVLISGEEDALKIVNAIDLGASGFIPKSSEPDILIAALRLVLSGGTYLPEQVIRAQTSSLRRAADDNSTLERLSNRQLEVLTMVVDGKTNKIIARKLGLSEGTIKAHLSGAYRALGVSKRSEAVILASKVMNAKDA